MATTFVNNGMSSLSNHGLIADHSTVSDLPPSDFDDSAVFGDGFSHNMLHNGPIFGEGQSNTWDFIPTPPDRGLYSTPLSWEAPHQHQQHRQPQQQQQQQPLSQPPQVQPIFQPTMSTLSPAQREKLRNIAMPNHLQYNHQSPESIKSTQKSDSGSPDQNENTRKRKSSDEAEDDDDDDEDGAHPPVKKTAHNMIEKRYRTNLNDKIAALRDSVPSLRVMSKNARGEDTTADREDLQGLTPAHKLNKATVLSKATEYIRHLEKRNKRLQDDNLLMKGRIAAFEKLFMSGSMGINPVQSPIAFGYQHPDPYMSPNGQMTPSLSPEGMIDVPEDIRRMNAQVMRHNQHMYQGQDRYIPTSQAQAPPPQVVSNGWAGNGYFGKMMVGSLAGLMILEGFSEAEPRGDEPAGRGLFSLPVGVIRSLGRSFPIGFSNEAYLGAKVMLILSALFYVVLPVLSSNTSPKAIGKSTATTLTPAPPLASSIHHRRRAWLTSIQTVWVPRHNFFLEALALIIKAAKLSLRNTIGWYGYAVLTGTTQEQEAARIKAWSIALDAQLGGGDVEISVSRLCLTFLASGTLPDTPARLMMKALHIRILLWELGNAGAHGFYMFQDLAASLARWKWTEARQVQLRLASSPQATDVEPLDPHLAALLECDCDEVLVASIAQRAHNLAWNRSTTLNTLDSSDGMDGVVSDFAIRSPLDAVAAWFSSLTLQSALRASLAAKASSEDQRIVGEKLALAIATAPVGSSAHGRAIVARTVLLEEKRGANIATALQVLRPAVETSNSSDSDEVASALFIDGGVTLNTESDLGFALKCAAALAHLQRETVIPSAYSRILSIRVPADMSFLSFVAAYKLMIAIDTLPEARVRCDGFLALFAGNLRIWIGGKTGSSAGLPLRDLEGVVEGCKEVVSKTVVCSNIEYDEGYGSTGDDEISGSC